MTIQIKKKLEEEIRTIEYELKNDLPKELKKAAHLLSLRQVITKHRRSFRQIQIRLQ